MYRRLFTLAHRLEEGFESKDEASFQYIITTTEPPPPQFQKSPWLLDPPLSARTAEERLLKQDLR
jgi:hypothetical protein